MLQLSYTTTLLKHWLSGAHDNTQVCVCVMKSEIMRTMQVTMCRIMMCVWSQVMVEQSWPRVMGTQVSPGRIHTVCQCSICAMLVLVCASLPWFNCKKPRVGRRSFQRRKKNNAKKIAQHSKYNPVNQSNEFLICGSFIYLLKSFYLPFQCLLHFTIKKNS